MGAVRVHELMSLDGVIDAPTWTADYGFDPRMAELLGTVTGQCRDEVDGDLYVSGSITLVRAMLEDGLLDELDLFVYPLTRGPGPRLFPEGAPPRSFSLAACESYENGVVYVAYRPQG